MKRMAMIKDGIVINIALWDGVKPWNPEGFQLIDVTNIKCEKGYIYSNGAFFEPPPEIVPQE